MTKVKKENVCDWEEQTTAGKEDLIDTEITRTNRLRRFVWFRKNKFNFRRHRHNSVIFLRDLGDESIRKKGQICPGVECTQPAVEPGKPQKPTVPSDFLFLQRISLQETTSLQVKSEEKSKEMKDTIF